MMKNKYIYTWTMKKFRKAIAVTSSSPKGEEIFDVR